MAKQRKKKNRNQMQNLENSLEINKNIFKPKFFFNKNLQLLIPFKI